jgi:hypothetical protein
LNILNNILADNFGVIILADNFGVIIFGGKLCKIILARFSTFFYFSPPSDVMVYFWMLPYFFFYLSTVKMVFLLFLCKLDEVYFTEFSSIIFAVFSMSILFGPSVLSGKVIIPSLRFLYDDLTFKSYYSKSF